MGIKIPEEGAYRRIAEWLEWYSGKVNNFHSYSTYNGINRIKRERASMLMAKKVCEDWANLLMNERVGITAGSAETTRRVNEILEENNFRVCANRLIELTFAAGTGAFVEFVENGKIKLDYIRADMIFPISHCGGRIFECAFASTKQINGVDYIYIQAHILHGGRYIIKNKLFEKSTGHEAALPDGIPPIYFTNSSVPFFQIIMPNVLNNADTASPMGISVYANALDIIRGIDLIFDSFQNEYRLGKKRIFVPVSFVELMTDENGRRHPVFDPNDTEFYALPSDSPEDCGIKEINMEIRGEVHRRSLQFYLDLLSDRCGLGTKRYSYEGTETKTATEIVSEQSELFRNMKKHELILETALKGLVRAVLFLDGRDSGAEISVDFDDSIISDSTQEFSQNLQLYNAGIMSAAEFRMRWFGETHEQAEKNAEYTAKAAEKAAASSKDKAELSILVG